MNTLWIMNATMTNRRHFFLIESTNNDASLIEESIISAGFRSNDLSAYSFSNGSTQVILHRSSSDKNPFYIGGIIIPNDKMIKNAKAKDRLIGSFGKFFLLSFIVYIILWIASFMVMLTGLTVALQFIGPAIFFMSFSFLVFGACISGLFFYLDLRVAKQNQKLVERAFEVLVPSLQESLNVQIQRSSISTKLGNRRIKVFLPEDIVTKIEHLEFGLIDAYFWDYD
jgi:hypothetical protein